MRTASSPAASLTPESGTCSGRGGSAAERRSCSGTAQHEEGPAGVCGDAWPADVEFGPKASPPAKLLFPDDDGAFAELSIPAAALNAARSRCDTALMPAHAADAPSA